MDSLSTLTAAKAEFSAARRIEAAPPGHACHGWHGHNFTAAVLAALPAGRPPEAEVDDLRRRLEACVAPLHMSDLGERVAAPDDAHIARWLHAQGSLPAPRRAAVYSTSRHGAECAADGTLRLFRRYAFQAAHRLPHVPEGHKCGRMHGHGFEVVLAMSAGGADSAWLGYERLDRAWAPLHRRLGHACLNDIEGLENPTSEMISSWIWSHLRPELPGLDEVRVYETATAGADFDGQRHGIWKDFTIDSAVRRGRAGALHGHTYLLRLHLHAPLDTVLGWTVDFGDVKSVFDPTFERLDHRALHEIPGLEDGATGTVARWVFEQVRRELPQLSQVALFETAGCGALVGPEGARRPWLPPH